MIFDNLILNSCWDYKCIISSNIYDMLTFSEPLNGIFLWFLWLQLPLSIYGTYTLIRKFVTYLYKRYTYIRGGI